jgi:hypothetical protein
MSDNQFNFVDTSPMVLVYEQLLTGTPPDTFSIKVANAMSGMDVDVTVHVYCVP